MPPLKLHFMDTALTEKRAAQDEARDARQQLQDQDRRK